LETVHWSSIRKGATFGCFVGWLSLAGCISNALGFIFGSILMSDDTQSTLVISDIIVVSVSHNKFNEKIIHMIIVFF
jgi:hypothetical protein